MARDSTSFKTLCTEYHDLHAPLLSPAALKFYSKKADESRGALLAPMCGTGRVLIPLLEKGYSVTGFDHSPYMLALCDKNCRERGLRAPLVEADFANFIPPQKFSLAIIPHHSFSHLTTEGEIHQALQSISNSLQPGGKALIEIETLKAMRATQGRWQGNWVTNLQGSQIVQHSLATFDPATHIESILCRYELWEENRIARIEVEERKVKLYEPKTIERLLSYHQLKVIGRWNASSYRHNKGKQESKTLLYECMR